MKAIGGVLSDQRKPDRDQPDLDRTLAMVRDLAGAVQEDSELFDFFEASEFAGRVEDLSRTVDYLQLVAAAAVDRTRKAAVLAQRAPAGWGTETGRGSAAGWMTGWTHQPCADPDDGPGGVTGAESAGLPRGGQAGTAAEASAVADDGYRNPAEFLRSRLRISMSEAKRRLALAADVLPRTGITGLSRPAARPEVAAAVAAGTIASHAASIITTSLDRVRRTARPETLAGMEHALTLTAAGNDHDFLARVASHWSDALDQDGAEPAEELLRQLQGAFVRKRRHGLHHLEIFATTDQYEHLCTVMNVATNPRVGRAAEAMGNAADAGDCAAADRLDPRTRAQRLLDGLVGACKAALSTGTLSAAGGLRPQIMATIDYRDLFESLGAGGSGKLGTPGVHDRSGDKGHLPGGANGTGGVASFLFTGPVTASTIRKIACDAGIIPVLLGGEGRILDIGRASRIFPTHIRKAITARDRGCAFPHCTIPASWCEAHHITYWSLGGTTGTENGALLCSHHHHVIHKEQWTIRMRSGVPWFIPPPHLDPRQQPRRNHFFSS